jgi:hypothetical protein
MPWAGRTGILAGFVLRRVSALFQIVSGPVTLIMDLPQQMDLPQLLGRQGIRFIVIRDWDWGLAPKRDRPSMGPANVPPAETPMSTGSSTSATSTNRASSSGHERSASIKLIDELLQLWRDKRRPSRKVRALADHHMQVVAGRVQAHRSIIKDPLDRGVQRATTGRIAPSSMS